MGMMADALYDDFDIFADDWGEMVLIKHNMSESVNISTGQKEPVFTEVYVIGVAMRQVLSSNVFHLNAFTSADKILYIRDDTPVAKNDLVVIAGESFRVNSFEQLKRVLVLNLRRST